MFQHGYPVSLAGHRPLEQVAHIPGVAEVLVPVLVQLVKQFGGIGPAALVQGVAVLLSHGGKDLHELIPGIVVKVEILVEPAFQARVGVDEAAHQLGIARHDDHQIRPVVL